MKSASIVIGLIVGCLVAGPFGYIDGSSITRFVLFPPIPLPKLILHPDSLSAPAVTFLWVQTYPLKIHGPSILPMMAVYIALAMEATGDIVSSSSDPPFSFCLEGFLTPAPPTSQTASSEASRQPVSGPLFDSRIQGGILADGVNGLLSGLAMNVSYFRLSPLQRETADQSYPVQPPLSVSKLGL